MQSGTTTKLHGGGAAAPEHLGGFLKRLDGVGSEVLRSGLGFGRVGFEVIAATLEE